MFVPLAPLLAILVLMTALAVFLERFLLVFGWLIDRLWVVTVSMDWRERIQVEREIELEIKAQKESDVLSQTEDEIDPEERPDQREIDLNPDAPPGVDPDRTLFEVKALTPKSRVDRLKIFKEFYLHIIGTLIAIVVCSFGGVSVWDLLAWTPESTGAVVGDRSYIEYVLTGIIIGAGSKPIHLLIEFLVSRKVRVTKASVKKTEATAVQPAQALMVTAPTLEAGVVTLHPVDTDIIPARNRSTPAALEKTVGFVYEGGDRPGRLETTHLRTSPIDLIVYHHTAMHSDASYEDVVAEFDRKGWLTGYHCVIFKDGSIRFICRWDRIGNHARGVNYRSLGVALNGNFEPNPNVAFSNPDGRMGIQHPTNEQVDAMARITALWAHLYDVKVQFPVDQCAGVADDMKKVKGIAPHCLIAPKACPGSNFPHDLFQAQVKDYHQTWGDDDCFLDALERYKLTPMVKVG